MNELRRFKVHAGKRVAFNESTDIDYPYDEPLNYLLWEETESDSDERVLKSPQFVNVTPGQKINFYGIIITVPQDSAKMAKWSSDSIKSAFVYFLNSDDEVINNGIGYRICMDNCIELEEFEESGEVS